METKEVNLKKYIPADGKALKIILKNKLRGVEGVGYSKEPAIIDEDELAEPVEEVELEEYEKWMNSGCLAVGSLIR